MPEEGGRHVVRYRVQPSPFPVVVTYPPTSPDPDQILVEVRVQIK